MMVIEQVVLLPIASKREWIGRLEQLLAMYRAIGVGSAWVLRLESNELSPKLMQTTVHWALHDGADGLLYQFEATYTLARLCSQARS